MHRTGEQLRLRIRPKLSLWLGLRLRLGPRLRLGLAIR